MRNLGRGLLGVLAVALEQRDNSQIEPFKGALTCVRSLCDFTMMAQYGATEPRRSSIWQTTQNVFMRRETSQWSLCYLNGRR